MRVKTQRGSSFQVIECVPDPFCAVCFTETFLSVKRVTLEVKERFLLSMSSPDGEKAYLLGYLYNCPLNNHAIGQLFFLSLNGETFFYSVSVPRMETVAICESRPRHTAPSRLKQYVHPLIAGLHLQTKAGSVDHLTT